MMLEMAMLYLLWMGGVVFVVDGWMDGWMSEMNGWTSE